MVDPTNLRSLDHIKFKTGKDVEPVIGTEAGILAVIDRAYVGGKDTLSDLIGGDEDKDLVLDAGSEKALKEEESSDE